MGKAVDLIGRKFGRLTVIERAENRGKYVAWKCLCDCGNEKVATAYSLTRGSTLSCGCLQRENAIKRNKEHITYQDLSGKRFGRLTALKYAGNSKWECKCDCGNTKTIRTGSLKSGLTRSCGCLLKETSGKEAEDLSGQCFGKLTVIERAKNKGKATMWHCRCECGNETIVSAGHLKEGATKSCGCSSVDRRRDLSGIKFGKLTAVNPVKMGKRGMEWLCRCDCGNNHTVAISELVSGNTTSCGCSRRKYKYIEHKRIYHVWRTMIARCYNPNTKAYKNYGGRGIAVCNEWLGEKGYENFYIWAMKNGYDENAERGKCTIDRINNNGNYEPSNCRWVDMKVQNNNKRR